MKILFTILMFVANPVFGSTAAPTIPDMNFSKIQAKSFLMGSADSENGRNIDEGLHMVSLTRDFEIQTTTITQAQWFQIMQNNPSEFKARSFCPASHKIVQNIELCANLPVESVGIQAVHEFIQKLNSLDEKFQYRLPTEAEWEFAARGGHGDAYFFGYDETDMDLYLVEGTEQPAPVASKLANPYGLYDMLGNVAQWVEDYWGFYPPLDFEHPTIDPKGPKGEYRIVRGGSWDDYISNRFRCASRKFVEASFAQNTTGFRLVRELK